MAAGPVVPDSASLLQQVQPAPALLPEGGATGLRVERAGNPEWAGGGSFVVSDLLIRGNTLFDTNTLHGLVAEALGRQLTLTDLGQLIARITAFYRTQGYPLARAIIPAQTIQGGQVVIEVIEPRLESIRLNNASAVQPALLQETLEPLRRQPMIRQDVLDRSLLLLSDIPGIVLDATLKPGQSVGTSDLQVGTAPGQAVTGQLAMDDQGSRYTGRARLSGTVSWLNPLHRGDVLSVNALSAGERLNYGRLHYETLLNGQGDRAGISLASMRYTLGEALAALSAHGTADVSSAWARHPFVRSLAGNLYGQIQLDAMSLRDHTDVSSLRNDRQIGQVSVSLSGDLQDAWLPAAIETASLSVTGGRVRFDDAAALAADAATARTRGTFVKWNASLSHLQKLSDANAVYASVATQWANANLDSSQKMFAGGPASVRAYDSGAVSGDLGTLVSVELRHNLAPSELGPVQVLVFVDSARVRINRSAWVAGLNAASLSGVGVAVNWSGRDHWNVNATLAARIGAVSPLVGSSPGVRLWLSLSKSF
jgi:hemolysin activation/secretion protein